jgi:hypothetical protein
MWPKSARDVTPRYSVAALHGDGERRWRGRGSEVVGGEVVAAARVGVEGEVTSQG